MSRAPSSVGSKGSIEVPSETKMPPEAAEGSAPTLPEFFLVCTPGLEDITEKELQGARPDLEPELKIVKERGGLTVFAPLEFGLALNVRLKTPTRILLRLMKFGCRDFPKLFKKIGNFPWEDWVSDTATVEFETSTHRSRLRIKKRLAETCADARRSRLKKRGVSPVAKGHNRSELVTAFLRLDEDVATLSIDTSGEILHKRGAKPLAADAPLRETTAAALLQRLATTAPLSNRSVEIVDPMTGGGTFLLEAFQMRLANRHRAFAFQSFSKRMAFNDLSETSTGLSWPHIAKLVGFDLDEKALRSAAQNLGELGASVELKHEDFFMTEPLANDPSRERWFIVNPPYGERLKIEGRLNEFYERLMAEAERVVRPDRACFLLPEKCGPDRLKIPGGWKRVEIRRFQNGGLPVAALFFMRKARAV